MIAKEFEGYSSIPYKCPAGVWTIGYGTTRYPNGVRVKPTDKPCTKEQAEHWLNYTLALSQSFVLAHIKVKLNEHQLCALTDFTYNVGMGAFRASTLRRRINNGRFDDVPYQLSRWNKGGGRVLRGLTLRRKAEANEWNYK